MKSENEELINEKVYELLKEDVIFEPSLKAKAWHTTRLKKYITYLVMTGLFFFLVVPFGTYQYIKAKDKEAYRAINYAVEANSKTFTFLLKL